MSSLEQHAKEWELKEELVRNLSTKGFDDFFPVQKQVIPKLLAQNCSPCIYPQDICVSAPTGSGKTLSYALPILNTLLSSVDTIPRHRLRALILLPSRELAQQVFKVFQELVEGTIVKVVLTTGARSFSKEQELVTGPTSSSDYTAQLGKSQIDVMISTPGRLLDHIHFTVGFTLQHLRFLVLDEADRLLGNAYHGWVRTLMNSTDQLQVDDSIQKPLDIYGLLNESGRQKRPRLAVEAAPVFKMPLQRLLFSATLSEEPAALALMGVRNPLFIRTKGSLVSVDDAEEEEEAEQWEDGAFTIPASLAERQLQVDTQTRLLILLNIMMHAFRGEDCRRLGKDVVEGDAVNMEHLGLCEEKGSICLIFVSSVEASHRLASVLAVCNGQHEVAKDGSIAGLHEDFQATAQQLLFRGRVEEMSRLVHAEDREAVVSDAAAGKVSVIVSTDRMARGIDLPGVKMVINFDCPNHIKTYVHRAGRTARANRFGMCLTFLKRGQVTQFKAMRMEASAGNAADDSTAFPVKNLKVDHTMDEYLTKPYHEAVRFKLD